MSVEADFVNQYNGKPLEAEDSTNLDQCMDLAFGLCDKLGIPREAIRHLRAYQVFTLATDVTRKYFDVIAYTPGLVVRGLDLVIWKGSGMFTGVNGHIDMGLSGSDSQHFRAFDQNWAGHSYCEILTHPYNDVIGILRPKGVSMATDALTKEEIIVIHNLATEGGQPGADLLAAYIGKPLDGLLNQLAADPSIKAIQSRTANATAVAEVRAGYLARIAQAAGDNPDHPIVDADVTQIINVIANQNATISDLTKKLQAAQSGAATTDSQAADVVAAKANPLMQFLALVWGKIFKKGQ